MSSWKLSKALSLEMIQLKEKVARFSSSSPFQNLEIIATLGVGGFGRVELVRGLRFKHPREAFDFFVVVVLYSSVCWRNMCVGIAVSKRCFEPKLRKCPFPSVCCVK